MTRVSMDAEHTPNLSGTSDPKLTRVTLALRDQYLELHFPTFFAKLQEAMDVSGASLVDVELDERGHITAVYINGITHQTQ